MHLQFISTLEANVEALTGSPVKVTIDSVTSGSVVVTETYAFLDNSVTSAANLATVLTSSDSSSVFGTTFGPVTVAAGSVKTGTVTNPSSKHYCTLVIKQTHSCTAAMHMTLSHMQFSKAAAEGQGLSCPHLRVHNPHNSHAALVIC